MSTDELPLVCAAKAVAQASCLWGRRASCPARRTAARTNTGRDARSPHRQDVCATTARLAAARFVARLSALYVQIARSSSRRIRLFPELRRSFTRSGARSEAPRDRFVRLRTRRLERRAVRDRAKCRFRFFSEKRRDHQERTMLLSIPNLNQKLSPLFRKRTEAASENR